jgi:hypothetical protein
MNFQHASRFGWYLEPLAISVYAADFIFVAIVLFFGKKLFEEFKKNWILLSAIIIFFLAQSARNSDPTLGVYVFLRFFQVAVLLLLFSIIIKSKTTIKMFCVALLIIGVLQSALVIYQVTNSHSLSLKWLGEQTIDIGKAGVAKVDLANGKLLRGYGTLPHPNILAGLLTITIAANLWLIRIKTKITLLYHPYYAGRYHANKISEHCLNIVGASLCARPRITIDREHTAAHLGEPRKRREVLPYGVSKRDTALSYQGEIRETSLTHEKLQTNQLVTWTLYCTLLLQTIGMILTFSRAGFVSLIILFFFFLFSQTKKGTLNLKKWGIFILLTISLFILINSFTGGAIYQRLLPPKTDVFLSERIFLFQNNWEIFRHNLFLGIGNGQYINNYIIIVPAGTEIEKWQYDYPHNVIVQSCSELGILGFLIFALLVFTLIKYNTKNWRYFWFAFAIIFSYLMFDHFLWTNQSGRILLVLSLTLLPKILEPLGDGSVEFGDKKINQTF